MPYKSSCLQLQVQDSQLLPCYVQSVYALEEEIKSKEVECQCCIPVPGEGIEKDSKHNVTQTQQMKNNTFKTFELSISENVNLKYNLISFT